MVEDYLPKCLDSLIQLLVRVETNILEQKKVYGDIVNSVLNYNGDSGTIVLQLQNVRISQGSCRKNLLQNFKVVRNKDKAREVA